MMSMSRYSVQPQIRRGAHRPPSAAAPRHVRPRVGSSVFPPRSIVNHPTRPFMEEIQDVANGHVIHINNNNTPVSLLQLSEPVVRGRFLGSHTCSGPKPLKSAATTPRTGPGLRDAAAALSAIQPACRVNPPQPPFPPPLTSEAGTLTGATAQMAPDTHRPAAVSWARPSVRPLCMVRPACTD